MNQLFANETQIDKFRWNCFFLFIVVVVIVVVVAVVAVVVVVVVVVIAKLVILGISYLTLFILALWGY